MKKPVKLISPVIICLTLGLLISSLAGQTKPKPGPDQALQLQTELLEVRAVVKDKQGHIIKDLKKEDFEVLENKNPQEISFFSTESVSGKPGDSPAGVNAGRPLLPNGAPARTVVLYVDTLNLSVSSLLWTKQALNKFVDQQLTPEDVVALITSTGSLGVLEQFTRDRRILHYAINRLSPGPSISESHFTPYVAGMVEHGDRDALRFAISVLRNEDHLSGDARTLAALARGKAADVLAEATYRRSATLYTLKAVAERMAELPGQRIIAVLSDGFTLMDRSGSPDTSDLNTAISRAVRSGVVMYTIDAKGLTAPPGFSAAYSGAVNSNLLNSFLSMSEQDERDGLNALARDTGGEPFFNSNDIGSLLKRVLDENQFYYTLAYYPTGETNSRKYRNITVKVKNHPEYVIRAQKGYSPQELLAAKKEEALTPQQKMFQAIAAPLPITTIGIASTADFLGREGDPHQVVFQTYVEGKNIDYREQEKRYHFELDLVTVVYGSNGKPVFTYNDKAEGKLPPENLEAAKQTGYRFTKTLSLKPGLYQIRIGVREPATEHLGTAMAWINVPNLEKNKLTMSGIFLGDPAAQTKPVTSNSTASSGSPSQVRQGIRFYKPGSTMTYNVRLYNTGSTSNNGADLTIHAQINQSGATIFQAPWQPVSSAIIGKDNAGIDLGGLFKLGMEPGIYELTVQVKDPKSKRPVEQTVIFGVEP